ncbi:hypothetical protein L798_11690 [Zootermopsis nevadensis]|uniref:Uncharacterized protein n=2 Tax=Zootermopsis nevadensis TaxID=136037 RepID=A0A067R485_ZOONE|nr:hypothetical protein L798_11690 [Zootermopsis nevadensis]
MWKAISKRFKRPFLRRNSLRRNEENQTSQGRGNTNARSKEGKQTDAMSSKQMIEEHLPVTSFQSKEHQTEEKQCSSFEDKSDIMTVLQKLRGIDKVSSEREMLVNRSENYEHVDERLETVNEHNALKTEIAKLKVKMAELIQQRHDDMRKIEETIEGLNEIAENIVSENSTLLVKLVELAHQQDSENNKMAETIEGLNDAVAKMSLENATLQVKTAELAHQQDSEKTKMAESIKCLNDAVAKMSFENSTLLVKMTGVRGRPQCEAKINEDDVKCLNVTADRESSENDRLLRNCVQDDNNVVARSKDVVELRESRISR